MLLVALLILYKFELSKLKIIKKDTEAQKKDMFEKIVQLKGQPLETFAFDYTYWDEMVKFVKDPNTESAKKWADETIATALGTYNANFVWIYDSKYKLIYTVNNVKNEPIYPFDESLVKKIFSNGKYANFFLRSPLGILELRAASIHPSYDYNRFTYPKGYFFVAKLWTKSYMDEISKMTQTKISIIPIINDIFENNSDDNDIIHFSKILYGYDNKPIIKLDVNTQSAALRNLIALTNNTLYVAVIFLVFVIAVISVFSIFSIKRPISLLIKSLQTKDTTIIKNLIKKEKSEFGILARLITAFFEQQNLLIGQKTELSETKIRLHAFVDHIPFVAWLKDKDSKFITVNKPYANLTGYKIEDIIGKDDYDIWPKDFAEFNMKSDKEIFASKQQSYFDEKLPFIKNQPWYEVYKTPIINEKGEVIGLTGIARDISINKKADNFTKKQRDLIKIMLDSLQESIIISSVDGFILECNDNTLNLFKINSKEKILDTSIFQLFPENIKEQVIEDISFIMENGGTKDFTYNYFTKDGNKSSLKSRISLANDFEGKPSYLITKTKKLKDI
jgi:PAS domain S-box-containing protein